MESKKSESGEQSGFREWFEEEFEDSSVEEKTKSLRTFLREIWALEDAESDLQKEGRVIGEALCSEDPDIRRVGGVFLDLMKGTVAPKLNETTEITRFSIRAKLARLWPGNWGKRVQE